MYTHEGISEELGEGLVVPVDVVVFGVGVSMMTASLQFPAKSKLFTARTCREIS